jgi:hypothetical protein
MYDLIFGQNGHFNKKKPTKRTMCFSCPMFLVKVNILLVSVDTLVKLNLLKNHDFL